MEAIFYDEAIELLGVTPGTLYHAVTRKVLTRLPRKGQKQCLIKEQVLLFKGKRLSPSALSPQERVRWNEYARLAETPVIHPPIERLEEIIDQRVSNQVDPLMQALKPITELVNQWESRPKAPALA